MNLAELPRTIRTARHLKPGQIAWRMRYRIRRGFKPRSPEVPTTIRRREDLPAVPLVNPLDEIEDSTLVDSLDNGVFRHLNHSMELGVEAVDWCLGPRTQDRLWVISLHYHHWAWRLANIARHGGREARRADALLRHYLRRWIEDCDLERKGSRDLAWNSYAIATRIGWWCRIHELLGASGRSSWGDLERKFLRSLWKQAAYLHDNLEYDLRANHLLRDAVGLAWAGRFFGGAAPDQWLETATRLGIEQAHEQVLADGGHFERSPMYHLHAMDDILALSHLVRDDGKSEDLRSVWMRMAEFQTWMNHPDGNVPLFNDAALNGACLPAEMLRVGCASFGVPELKQRTRGGHMFEDFGMAVCHGERLSVFFDIGQVGPDYQPGHAHADSLTLECSVDGARLFVDPGTLCYERGAERDYDRSTEAHNTVCVDQENSTETWHVFRVGRRARPVDVRCEDTMGEFAVTASHDGYRWKTSRPRHTREVRVSDSGILRIADRIESDDSHHVRGGFLLSPEWSVIASDTRGWTLRGATSSVLVTVDGPPDLCLSVEPREYHPEFHKRIDTDRICWTTSSRSPIEVVVTVTPG